MVTRTTEAVPRSPAEVRKGMGHSNSRFNSVHWLSKVEQETCTVGTPSEVDMRDRDDVYCVLSTFD